MLVLWSNTKLHSIYEWYSYYIFFCRFVLFCYVLKFTIFHFPNYNLNMPSDILLSYFSICIFPVQWHYFVCFLFFIQVIFNNEFSLNSSNCATILKMHTFLCFRKEISPKICLNWPNVENIYLQKITMSKKNEKKH